MALGCLEEPVLVTGATEEPVGLPGYDDVDRSETGQHLLEGRPDDAVGVGRHVVVDPGVDHG